MTSPLLNEAQNDVHMAKGNQCTQHNARRGLLKVSHVACEVETTHC